MKTPTICIAAAAALLGSALQAQDITGVWEGTVIAGPGSYRQLMKISKADSGWKAVYYSLDEAAEPVTATSVVLKDGNLTLTFPINALALGPSSYEGKLGADHRSFTGAWIQRDGRFPLDFHWVAAPKAWAVPPAHTVRFVAVDSNVKLEVIDWGGSGRPLVFLSGLGNTAHDFNWFAPKFTPTYHVYGITRRGDGASSTPPLTTANYAADRLGDDVLAVIDSLGLRRPVLVGHSIAGEELSSIGSRHPEKVAGLIYLEAGNAYAFYDPVLGDFELDRLDVEQKLEQLRLGMLSGPDRRTLMHALRDSIIPRLERDADHEVALLDVVPASEMNAWAADTAPNVARAILEGAHRYTNISVPILAIFALPHKPWSTPGADSAADARYRAQDDSLTARQAAVFERDLPSARVVRLPNSTHEVYQSNEADVLREMQAFLASLSSR